MTNIDWDKMSKMYDKLKEKPAFKDTTPIEQPTPESMDGSVKKDVVEGKPVEEVRAPTKEEIDAEFEAKLEEDKRIMMERLAKKKGGNTNSTPTYSPNNPVKNNPKKSTSKLERRIEYLEEAVQLLMKQQMEMLRG